jgi:hypothetical protein
MPETFAPETLLDTVTAARRLGVSPSFLAKARMRGVGPRYRKFGRAVRYAPADLDKWQLACSRTSTAEQPAVTGLVRTLSAEPEYQKEPKGSRAREVALRRENNTHTTRPSSVPAGRRRDSSF